MTNKIAVDIATNEALYSGTSLEFRDGYLVGEGFRDRSCTPENTLLVEHDQPTPWTGRGWLYLDGGFDVAPWWRDAIENPQQPIHEWSRPAAIAAALAQVNAGFETAMQAVRAEYPESEVLSWPKQESEARAWQADAGAATPLLDAMVAARGMDKAELAGRIIVKADAYAVATGQLIGRRQALEDALQALPADAPPEQIQAIAWRDVEPLQ